MSANFYRITCILQDGTIKTGIIKNTSADTDLVYINYLRQAEQRFGGRLDEFDCVQLSTHNKDVKKLLKGTITNIPDEQPDQWSNLIDLPGEIKQRLPSRKDFYSKGKKPLGERKG